MRPSGRRGEGTALLRGAGVRAGARHGLAADSLRRSALAADAADRLPLRRPGDRVGRAQPRHRPHAVSEPRLAVENGHTTLLLDGAVQSIAPGGEAGGYWPLLLPPARPESALVLGLGGGTVARLLMERFGPLPIAGV